MKSWFNKCKKLILNRKNIIALTVLLLIIIVGGIFAIKSYAKSTEKDDTLSEVGQNRVSSSFQSDADTKNLNLTISNENEARVKTLTSDEKEAKVKTLSSSEDEDLTFVIDTIDVNEAVCVGKIEIREGSVYSINVNAKEGEKIFVALNKADNISKYKGVLWKQFIGVQGNEVEAQFTDRNKGTYYVYVGNNGNVPLVNIEGVLKADNQVNDKVEIIEKEEKEDEAKDKQEKDKEQKVKVTASDEEISFYIDVIEANEAVCIGKIEIKKDSKYEITASAETGENIFVALYESDDISKYKGVEWKQFTTVQGNKIEAEFTNIRNIKKGTYYVYVGNNGNYPLKNVSGQINAVN